MDGACLTSCVVYRRCVLKKCESGPLNREHDPEFILIPLGLESLGTGVFEETPGEPIGLVVKAHFFMEAGCWARARL